MKMCIKQAFVVAICCVTFSINIYSNAVDSELKKDIQARGLSKNGADSSATWTHNEQNIENQKKAILSRNLHFKINIGNESLIQCSVVLENDDTRNIELRRISEPGDKNVKYEIKDTKINQVFGYLGLKETKFEQKFLDVTKLNPESLKSLDLSHKNSTLNEGKDQVHLVSIDSLSETRLKYTVLRTFLNESNNFQRNGYPMKNFTLYYKRVEIRTDFCFYRIGHNQYFKILKNRILELVEKSQCTNNSIGLTTSKRPEIADLGLKEIEISRLSEDEYKLMQLSPRYNRNITAYFDAETKSYLLPIVNETGLLELEESSLVDSSTGGYKLVYDRSNNQLQPLKSALGKYVTFKDIKDKEHFKHVIVYLDLEKREIFIQQFDPEQECFSEANLTNFDANGSKYFDSESRKFKFSEFSACKTNNLVKMVSKRDKVRIGHSMLYVLNSANRVQFYSDSKNFIEIILNRNMDYSDSSIYIQIFQTNLTRFQRVYRYFVKHDFNGGIVEVKVNLNLKVIAIVLGSITIILLTVVAFFSYMYSKDIMDTIYLCKIDSAKDKFKRTLSKNITKSLKKNFEDESLKPFILPINPFLKSSLIWKSVDMPQKITKFQNFYKNHQGKFIGVKPVTVPPLYQIKAVFTKTFTFLIVPNNDIASFEKCIQIVSPKYAISTMGETLSRFTLSKMRIVPGPDMDGKNYQPNLISFIKELQKLDLTNEIILIDSYITLKEIRISAEALINLFDLMDLSYVTKNKFQINPVKGIFNINAQTMNQMDMRLFQSVVWITAAYLRSLHHSKNFKNFYTGKLWESINRRQNHDYSIALKHPAINRYKDILPNSRSVFQLKTPVGGVNYFNATKYLNIHDQLEYIASQGPKPEHITNFWQMIIDSGSNLIVMLTMFKEGSRAKCAEYFSSEQGKPFIIGQNDSDQTIHVTLLEENFYPLDAPVPIVKVRKFKVSLSWTVEGVIEQSEKEIRHLQFISWPDHGVPFSPHWDVLIEQYDSLLKNLEGPIIVHCSAGVGRTGTFITFDKLRKNPIENIYEQVETTILQLRQERSKMVQTMQQMCFLFEELSKNIEKRLIK